MNFHWPFFHKSEPVSNQPLRSPSTGQFTLSRQAMARRSRAADVRCQLGVYVAKTTQAQRLAETEHSSPRPSVAGKAFPACGSQGMFAAVGEGRDELTKEVCDGVNMAGRLP